MDDTLKGDQQSHDLYAALMLSNLLDSEQDVKDQQEQLAKLHNEKIEIEAEDDQQQINLDVIWVPADKHPEIAPTEFANFIKTHGANTPSRNNSTLHRRKSILSQSLSVSPKYNEEEGKDEIELNRTLSEKKRHFLEKVMNDKVINNPTVFDRNSTSLDDSKIIAPRQDKSLLRRSAFSARGRSKKSVTESKRRSLSTRSSSTSTTKSNTSWDKNEGISLYDQPVNMSEWIDLGTASLDSNDSSQRGILSRVHDAESQLRSQQITEEETPPLPTSISLPTTPILEDISIEKKAASVKSVNGPKRPGIIRSATESTFVPTTNNTVAKTAEKRSSWLSSIFQSSGGDKKSDTKKSDVNTIMNNNASPLSGLATLFTRSLSMKSNISTTVNKKSTSSHTNSTNNKAPTTTSTTTSNNTNTTNNTTNNSHKRTSIITPTPTTPITTTTTTTTTKKKRSSRLEIPPPSERTFFNSNRLPLHVERAIYRLSHMKLADPRRPLRQQVLISNLMFWYLSIQQNDFQHYERIEQVQPQQPPPDLQQNNNKKSGNKMSRLIHSAKKKKSEVTQFVQLSSTAYNNEVPSPAKKSNVQFSLAPIPSHHYPILNFEKDEQVEDDVPLSHYRS